MLVVVVAAVVGRLDDGRSGAQTLGAVAAAVGAERAADLALHAVHGGAADLDDLHVQDPLVEAGVVVGHDDLPLQLAVGVEHLGGGVEGEAGDDAVGEHLLDAGGGVGVDTVDGLQQLVGAEELHELAREVDGRGVVGVVRPVDAARTAGAGRRDHVGHRELRAAGEDPGEDAGAAERDEEAAVGGVEEEALGVVGEEAVVGRGPVDVLRRLDDVAEVVFGLGALDGEAGLGGGEHRLVGAGDLPRGERGRAPARRDDRHRGVVGVGREPGVVGRDIAPPQYGRSWNPDCIAGICGFARHRGRQRNEECRCAANEGRGCAANEGCASREWKTDRHETGR